MAETPEDILMTLAELEAEASYAQMDYENSLMQDSKVISIAPGSPARRMWETRMALIEFVWLYQIKMEESEDI